MTETFTQAVRLTEVKRITNSTNGNPRFRITFADPAGYTRTLNTSSDSAFNYEIGNPGFRAGDVVFVRINGRNTINGMAEAGQRSTDKFNACQEVIA